MVRNLFISRSNREAAVLSALLVLFFSAAVLPAADQDKPVLSGLRRLDRQIRDVFRDKDVEAIIARIARFAYDYFYFTESAAGR
jgi:hypothetical protein